MSHDDQYSTGQQSGHPGEPESDSTTHPSGDGDVTRDSHESRDDVTADLTAVPVPAPPEPTHTAAPVPPDEEVPTTEPYLPPASFQPRGNLA